MIATEEVEYQRKGHIVLFVPDDAQTPDKNSQDWEKTPLQVFHMLTHALPCSLKATHVCIPISNIFFQFMSVPFLKTSSIIAGPYFRNRLRVHHGKRDMAYYKPFSN
jgi:hypothetical protein